METCKNCPLMNDFRAACVKNAATPLVIEQSCQLFAQLCVKKGCKFQNIGEVKENENKFKNNR